MMHNAHVVAYEHARMAEELRQRRVAYTRWKVALYAY